MKEGLATKYEPLQTESLNVLDSLCQVMLTDFGAYFKDFMPMMIEILQNVGTTNISEKKLRDKTIDTIGSIIIAVSDCEEKINFQQGVCEITEFLAKALQSGFSDDDPQDEACKNTLTQCAGFLQKDFARYMHFLLEHLVKDA